MERKVPLSRGLRQAGGLRDGVLALAVVAGFVVHLPG